VTAPHRSVADRLWFTSRNESGCDVTSAGQTLLTTLFGGKALASRSEGSIRHDKWLMG
jgi:hypothetical protein